MDIGLIGLGRMGANMAKRLRAAGHGVVGYDQAADSGRTVDSLQALVEALPAPRPVWLMLPHGQPTDRVITQLADRLEPGDIVIDGGNSHFSDDAAHAARLNQRGIGFLDVGVSGGLWGVTEGYALMAGGPPDLIEALRPVFEALKPPGPDGFVHAGPVGAGHFTKMVHNGIEYGMMQALGEGYAVMKASQLVGDPDAVIRSWRAGTVIRSWLLDLFARATEQDPGLDALAPEAAESGEARWMVQAALDLGVALPVTSASLYARQASMGGDHDVIRTVAALRHQFGGHRAARSDQTD